MKFTIIDLNHGFWCRPNSCYECKKASSRPEDSRTWAIFKVLFTPLLNYPTKQFLAKFARVHFLSYVSLLGEWHTGYTLMYMCMRDKSETLPSAHKCWSISHTKWFIVLTGTFYAKQESPKNNSLNHARFWGKFNQQW